jgi:hypothetical protein
MRERRSRITLALHAGYGIRRAALTPSFRICMESRPIRRRKSAGRLKITGWMQRTVVMAGAAAMQPADGSSAAPQIGTRFISSNFMGIVMAGQVRR